MIPTPFRFFEVEQEKLPAHATQFDEAKLGVAPETLDAVDVVLVPDELVFVMMDAVVFATLLVHPAAMWADSLTIEQRGAMGVSDSLVRISVGLEDECDLLADFAQALEQVNV